MSAKLFELNNLFCAELILEIRTSAEGYESLALHGAKVSDFVPFLDAGLPYIWIIGWCPVPNLKWWVGKMPVNSEGDCLQGFVRSVNFDLMLETKVFLESANMFNGSGVDLIQAKNKMPDTLRMDMLARHQWNQVLAKNGAMIRLDLPHPQETGVLTCFEKGYLIQKGGT